MCACVYIYIYIIMLYNYTKSVVHSPAGGIDFLVAGVLQRDRLAPYLSTICQDYVL